MLTVFFFYSFINNTTFMLKSPSFELSETKSKLITAERMYKFKTKKKKKNKNNLENMKRISFHVLTFHSSLLFFFKYVIHMYNNKFCWLRIGSIFYFLPTSVMALFCQGSQVGKVVRCPSGIESSTVWHFTSSLVCIHAHQSLAGTSIRQLEKNCLTTKKKKVTFIVSAGFKEKYVDRVCDTFSWR